MKDPVLVLIRSKVRGVHWTLDTGHCPVSVLVRHVAEQVGDRLSIVGSSHRLGKHHAYLEKNDYFGAIIRFNLQTLGLSGIKMIILGQL